MMTEKFLLLVDSGGLLFRRAQRPMSVDVRAGSLLIQLRDEALAAVLRRETPGMGADKVFKNLDATDVYLVCLPGPYVPLRELEARLFTAIYDLDERVEAYRSPSSLQSRWAGLAVGDEVDVQVDMLSFSSQLTGQRPPRRDIKAVVRYLGSLAPARDGLWVGVHLAVSGYGDGDGRVNGHQYFQTEPKTAIFLPVSRVRSPPRQPQMPAQTSADARRHPLGVPEHSPPQHIGFPPRVSGGSGLCVGERVVHVSDRTGQAEGGVVRWVGHLQPRDAPAGLYAGVHFDNPIGNGSGTYEDKQLFVAPRNHASIVPIDGLIREADYHCEPPSPRGLPRERTVPIQVQPSSSNFSAESYVQHRQKEKELREAAMDCTDNHQDGHIVVGDMLGIGLPASVKETSPKSAKFPSVSSESGPRKISIGRCMEVGLTGRREVFYGVVRWIGQLPGAPITMVGLEMETLLPQDEKFTSNGEYNGVQYFTCPPGKGLFVPSSVLRQDQRFQSLDSIDESGLEEESVREYTAPSSDDETLIGRWKGIQGRDNSCYLDASLYALFAHHSSLDAMLLRPPTSSDIPEYEELRDLLASGIVFPLRCFGLVRWGAMKRLRALLTRLCPDVSGLEAEEKDPEEILVEVFRRLLPLPSPLLRLRAGPDSDVAQLCPIVLDEGSRGLFGEMPKLQLLLEHSFFEQNLKLEAVPGPVLIIQAPRYGPQKIFPRIIPPQKLDVTDLLLNGPRLCGRCGELATQECPECYLLQGTSKHRAVGRLRDATFCDHCFTKVHKKELPKENSDHVSKRLSPPSLSKLVEQDKAHLKILCPVELELMSVVCIETSHYVTFSRVGGAGSGVWRWVLYDSMADRTEGETVPIVREVPEMSSWLCKEGEERLAAVAATGDWAHVPRVVDRLFKDLAIAVYARPVAKYASPK